MRLVFAGTPVVALPSLAALHAAGHEVLAVLTRPPAPAGRGRTPQASPVALWAGAAGIEIVTGRPGEAAVLDRLAVLSPDCVPVVAYGALVPPAALAIPRHGWVNLHFSLLPAWRGAAPVPHAILAGDELTGATVFALEEGLDTGPVFGRLVEPVGPRDTSGELLERLATAGAGLLATVVAGIAAGTAVAVPQPASGVSHAPKLTVDDARVSWNQPAFVVDRRVRACTPAPGAWTTLDGERVKLGPLVPAADQPRLEPGELAVGRHQVLAGTATEPVVLGEVRSAGRRAMPAPDWARGARLAGGECFE